MPAELGQCRGLEYEGRVRQEVFLGGGEQLVDRTMGKQAGGAGGQEVGPGPGTSAGS